MTASEPTTAELIERARSEARYRRRQREPYEAALLDALADRLAALAPLEPVGRLVAAMEARCVGIEVVPDHERPTWLAGPWDGFYAEGDTATEALAALADALGEDGGRAS